VPPFATDVASVQCAPPFVDTITVPNPATTMQLVTEAHDKLRVWGSDVDEQTRAQARRATRLPFVPGHVALMPDAHVGIGATIGSVIPTEGAIVPSFAGVDLGCGMIATETVYTASDLPDDLGPLMSLVSERIPAVVGTGCWAKAAVLTEIASRAAEMFVFMTGPIPIIS